MTRRVFHVAAALCMLAATVLTTSVTIGAQGSDEAVDASFEKATAFRVEFGLDATPATVRSAADDSSYSADAYGVPLSPDELKEMARRAEIQGGVPAAINYAKSDPTFAGAYLDQLRGGSPVFLFTKVPTDAASKLPEFFPAGSEIATATVLRSYAELYELRDRIIADWDDLVKSGVDVVRVGVNVEENTIDLGVHGLSDADVATLTGRYGDFIKVVEANAAHLDTCNSILDCRPMKGGLGINNVHSSQPYDCTTGWVVRRNDTGALAMLTAGHCVQLNGGLGSAWLHHADQFGNAINETWYPNGTGSGDVGLISLLSDEVPAAKNQMRRTNTSIANVTDWTVAVVGMQACRIGANSGLDCGLITHEDIAHWSEAPGGLPRMRVEHTIEYSFDSAGGDSGGPVFWYPTSDVTKVYAFGTHVHSWTDGDPLPKRSWATPYFWGRTEYSKLYIDGRTYDMCFTASC